MKATAETEAMVEMEAMVETEAMVEMEAEMEAEMEEMAEMMAAMVEKGIINVHQNQLHNNSLKTSNGSAVTSLKAANRTT